MTLLEFLRARLDEDESVARAATQGTWFLDIWEDESVFLAAGKQTGPDRYDREEYSGEFSEPENIEHAVRWQPARVLREVEAKRRIVAEHVHFGPDEWNPRYCIRCGQIVHGDHCLTVRYLALPYSDHPDYREEWKP